MEIDTFNFAGVGVMPTDKGHKIVVLMPKTEMSQSQALVMAAYLVAMADPDGTEFEKYLNAVLAT